MKRITKIETKTFVKVKLSTSKSWALAALLKIFEFQTEDEKRLETTTDNNSVGFTGFDGEILSSFAKQLKIHKSLSQKQIIILFKRIPKYWKQIINASNEEKLQAQVISARV